MESSSSLSIWELTVIFFLRPLLAIAFVLSLITLGKQLVPNFNFLSSLYRSLIQFILIIVFVSTGWLLAWKLVLVHVPLVQEVFGLKKKPIRSKPQTGRLSKIYTEINATPVSPPT
jgi:hypothetical protein